MKFWIICGMISSTLVMLRNLKEPVSFEAYRNALIRNAFLGPLSLIGLLFSIMII